MRIIHSIHQTVLALLSAVFLAGCTVADVFPNLEPALGLTPPATHAQEEAVSAPSATVSRGEVPTAPGNRLLIVRRNGNIYTIRPDGSAPFALTTNATRSRQFTQPTWSPDGEAVAWTEIDLSSNPMRSVVVTSRFDGSNEVRADVAFPPFYYYWSPDGTRLAYLSNWVSNNQPGMALRLVDVEGGEGDTTTLAEGQPFYISWAPDSQRMITHVGNEFVTLLSVDGEQEVLSPASSGFPAPQWSPDGNYLIYVVDEGQGGSLVITEQDGRVRRKVTTYRGHINFTLSPTTNQLAYIVTTRQTGTAFGSLYLVDIDTERTLELSEEPVLAFFWSPDGQKLAFIRAKVNAQGQPRLQWLVWNGERVRSYAEFLPSSSFLQRYLPFFDQYAQSMTIWSPDSTAFTYAGSASSRREGIWIQHLDTDEPTYLVDGSFAAWSPR